MEDKLFSPPPPRMEQEQSPRLTRPRASPHAPLGPAFSPWGGSGQASPNSSRFAEVLSRPDFKSFLRGSGRRPSYHCQVTVL